ncbi:MAG: acyltransferase [Fidelibacterota bacterium]|nr:MAG: acyltransferase [Candidatus Neomarinimicrobiota bacterium]
MQLTLIQNQPRLGAVESNLEAARSIIEHIDFDLLLLPELFATGYFFSDETQARQLSEPVPSGPTTQFLIDQAKAKGAYICGGLAERDGAQLYNTAILVGPEGLMGRYRKLHLFYEEKHWFAPGDRPPKVYQLGNARVGMMICFDWRYPEVARILTLQGAQIILHPANLVQPYCQDAMVTRCLENGVFAATANRIGTDMRADSTSLAFTGRSQVVNPWGEILDRAPDAEPAIVTVDIDPARADEKYVTEHNHLMHDRRPEHYGLICGTK